MKKFKLKSLVKIAWAHAVKDLKNAFRFRISLFNKILDPFLTMASFLVTYSAVFFASDTQDIGYIDRGNYVIYVLTGFLTYSAFRLAWGRTSLGGEKVMLTLQGILLAPGSRLYILVGKSFMAFVEIMMTVLVFAVTISFLHPTVEVGNVIIGSIAIFFLIVIFLSLDFIVSAIGIAQEGIAGFITTYVPKGFLLIGCVYYPIDVIPEFARPLVFLNPLYHAVNLFRSGFMTADLHFGIMLPFVYLLVLALVLPFVAAVVFEYVIKRWGIRGY